MTSNDDISPVKPTVIDLDPDQVVDDSRPAAENSTAQAPPQMPPKAKKRSSLALPAFAAALLIGAIAGGWLYRDVLASYFPSDEMRSLGARVDVIGKGHEELATQMQALDRLTAQLKTDVDALETTAITTAADAKSATETVASTRTTLAALEKALSETRTTVTELANRPAVSGDGTVTTQLPGDLAARLATLEQDVAALKAQKSGVADTAALTQTLANLKAKIEAGTPFADESDRLSRLLPAAAGLDVISQHAAAGLPAAMALATELAALKPSLPVPEAAATPENPGLWDRMVDAMSSIITIRDAGAVNWQQVADKAIVFAEAGDLPQAIAAIDAEEGALPAGLQQWRDRAAGRIALEAALAAVTQSADRVIAAEQ